MFPNFETPKNNFTFGINEKKHIMVNVKHSPEIPENSKRPIQIWMNKSSAKRWVNHTQLEIIGLTDNDFWHNFLSILT